MATQQTEHKYKQNVHRKKTRQGIGLGTKFGHKKGSIKEYRGQGGRVKRRKH